MSTFPSMTPEEDEVLAYACDQCDKSFGTVQALNGHKMVHVPATPCPECGRDGFASATSLARHRSIDHGIQSAKLKVMRAKEGSRPLGRPRKAAIDTGMTVDHIFQSVVLSLWPGGQMSTSAMLPLMEWRDATREMLEKVKGE